jgi:hypothetical protein
MGDDLGTTGEASNAISPFSFSSPSLSVPNVIPTDMEHKPHHYLVIAPRDDTPANISF